MYRIVLSTSSSGLDYLEKPKSVRVLRHHIQIDDDVFAEGDHISYQSLADRMMKDKSFMPITEPQGVDELLDVFEALYQEGVREVFIVTVSSMVSDTYDNMMEAKNQFDKDMFIHVYDSRAFAHNEAIMALEAAQMMDDGKKSQEIYNRLDTLRENSMFWMAIDDLSCFVKSKRISSAQGFFANMLKIKPVVEVDQDGFITPIEKVRNIEKAINMMCQYAAHALSEAEGSTYIVSFGNTELLEKTQHHLETMGLKNVPVYVTSPATLANLGPHGVGVGVVLDC